MQWRGNWQKRNIVECTCLPCIFPHVLHVWIPLSCVFPTYCCMLLCVHYWLPKIWLTKTTHKTTHTTTRNRSHKITHTNNSQTISHKELTTLIHERAHKGSQRRTHNRTHNRSDKWLTKGLTIRIIVCKTVLVSVQGIVRKCKQRNKGDKKQSFHCIDAGRGVSHEHFKHSTSATLVQCI